MTEKLLVTVVKGKDLESKDSNGLSDPYVVLKVGTTRVRTKVVPETLNPEYNETFVLSVNQFEPVRVEVWDHDQLSQDDFEGGFTLNWWTIDALTKTGAVNGMTFKLMSGHGLRKNTNVKGELVLDIRLANFAKELQERGKLTELFPDTPAGEVCLMTFDCSIARVAADSVMAGELQKGGTARRRAGSGDAARSVSERETMPGTIFLLSHFFYAYAVTQKEPMKLELSYEDIHRIEKSAYSRSGVVLTTTRGWKFLIDKLASPDGFIQDVKETSVKSLYSAVDIISNAAVAGDAAAGEGAAQAQTPRKQESQTPKPCEPPMPATVPFKVYLYEHDTLYKAADGSEPCPVSLFVGSKPSVTFKRVVEEAFVQAQLPHGNASKSRIFTVSPGVRHKKYAEQKLTSKWTIASCMGDSHIVWSGAPVILRMYEKGKSGIKIPNPAALVAAAASATAAVLKGSNTGPAEVNLSFFIPERGASVPFPIPPSNLKTIKFPTDEPLKTSVPRLLKEHAGVSYSPDKYELFISTLSAEPGFDSPLLIHVDMDKKPFELFLVDGDTFVLKELPAFKGVADKFAKCDSVEKTALMLACEFSQEPLLENEHPLDLNALAKELGLPESLVKEYSDHGAANAKFGVTSLLTELHDRLAHVQTHPIYNKEAFETEKSYTDWCYDERENVLALMRNFLFERQPFCAELHVRVCSADGIHASDISGVSDPYCKIMYKTQLQTTGVCMQTLHPKWEEEFIFSVSSLDKPMTFNLYDWDPLSAHDYLGTATLPFREQIGIFDGQKHTLTLPINKKGEMVVEVQAFFENSRFLDDTPSSEPAPDADYRDVYKRLYSALHEEKSIEPESPWLLREVAARTGVSQIFSSLMKLDALLKMEPTIDPDFNKCLYNNSMRILRPDTIANREEAKSIVEIIQKLYEYLRDKYMPYCFCNKDTTRPVMEQCVRLFVECCIGAKKTDEMADVLSKCVDTGVRGQCKLLTDAVAWNDEEKVGNDVRTLVCEQLLTFFGSLHSMYDDVMPTNIKPRIFRTLVSVFTDCVDECYAHMCDILIKPSKSYQGAVYAIMQATATLANGIKERTNLPLEIPSAKGLFILWVKNNSPLLNEWVERAITVDKFEPLQKGLLHSSSVVDVSESCSQIISQMKALTIPDVFVWGQCGEVLLGVMQLYFNLQKKRAMEIVQGHQIDMFSPEEEGKEGRALQKACIAIGNIEKGQELLDTIITSIEEGMDIWHKDHNDPDSDNRFDISSQALSENVAATMKLGQQSIADPIRVLATCLCNPLAVAMNEALASDEGLTEAMVNKVTGHYDDAIGAAHDLVSKKAFRMLLYSCWLISCDILSKCMLTDAPANGPKKGMNVPAVRDSIDSALSLLYDYFNPEEGEGLTQAQLDGARGYINAKRLICLYRQNTESLVAITRGFAAKPRRDPSEADPLLKDTTQKEVETIIKTRIEEGDLWARAYAKEMNGSDDSAGVREHFSLPPSELLLDKWVCSVGRKAGTLYLMSRHLCFDTAFSKAMNDTTSVVIMLEDILNIEEVNMMLLFKGLKITAEHMEADEIPVFSKFVTKAVDVSAAIRAQALIVGNTHLAEQEKKDDKK